MAIHPLMKELRAVTEPLRKQLVARWLARLDAANFPEMRYVHRITQMRNALALLDLQQAASHARSLLSEFEAPEEMESALPLTEVSLVYTLVGRKGEADCVGQQIRGWVEDDGTTHLVVEPATVRDTSSLALEEIAAGNAEDSRWAWLDPDGGCS